MITFEVEGDHLLVRKLIAEQNDSLKGLSDSLSEWNSPEDEEASRDL